MSELALDHDQRHTLVGHLDRVSMTELMRREAATHASRGGGHAKLLTRGRWIPPSSRRRAVDHAQEGADRELGSDLAPGPELMP
jgi:hypothetical protein